MFSHMVVSSFLNFERGQCQIQLHFKYGKNYKSVLCFSERSCSSAGIPAWDLAMQNSSSTSRSADPIIPTVVTNRIAQSIVRPGGCSAPVGFYSIFLCYNSSFDTINIAVFHYFAVFV